MGLTQPSAVMSGLTTGHTYEFSVSAENASGEGPRSAVVAVTPAIPPPPAPTGVTAVANTTGSITVSWSPVARAWRYQVFRRDLTAGQTIFEGLSKIGSDSTSQELSWMSNGHEYELYVVAEHGGGASPPSAPVRATVRNDPPPPPTGLTATSNADGTISLRWTAPASGLWYWVYQKDVTAGDTDYTKLPLPITSGTEMTAGYLMHEHLYEFAVAGLSGGGEGTKSAPARATARYPLPPAPVNLRATPGDGVVTLTWDATAPNHWYWIYQRDLTAGETTAGRLPLPISQGTTMGAGYLTNGHTYEWAVSAIGPGGSEGPKSAPVQAVPNPPLPVKPTSLTATPNADGTITLSWTIATPNVWHWVEMRDVTTGQAWGRLPYPLTSGSTFTAGLLQHEHTYEFRVVAFNNAGEGPTSDAVVATCRYTRPGAPTGLRGNTSGDGTIELSWTPPGPGGFYYWIYFRDVTAGETFVKGVYPTDKPSAGLGFLRHGHVYEFKVTAENLGGEGPASAAIQVTALGGLPAAPTSLTATAGDGQVTLRWTASPTASVWYWIEMRSDGGTWQRLPYPLTTCCTFNVTLLTNGTTYDFRVRATNASGDGAPSNVASARPMPPMPQPPTGLTASPGDGRVSLRWTASPTPNVWYWIEYRASGGAWQRLPYPVSTCCTFNVTYLTNGTTYEFRLRSTNVAGDSAPSNVASARPMPPFPQPPSGLSATPALGKATLRWTASPTANVWYWIEMRPTGGAWQRLPLPVTTCCTFVADYLGQPSYEFRVRATNLSGDSVPGNTVAVTIPAPPAPTGIKAEQAGPYQARISWNPVAGADAYIIYHSVATGGLGTTICRPLEPLPYPVMGGGTRSFTADYLVSGYIHCWAVAAVKYGRIGPMSGIDSMSPLWENVLYTEARCYFFDCGPPTQGQKGVISSRRASVDGGIVVARAFINGNSPYLPISDGFNRGFSSSPGASSKITVAWDTGRGQLGALVHRSCVFDLCKTALPLRFEYSGANDIQPVDYNYVWTEPASGDEVRFDWKASNAITYSVWHLGWHIDAEVRLWRYSGANYAAEMHADHFPSYEAYQYPHYTTLGFPEARTLTTCGQAQIDGLTDSPGERRWCQ
jgi:fibronectin type III domain protein